MRCGPRPPADGGVSPPRAGEARSAEGASEPTTPTAKTKSARIVVLAFIRFPLWKLPPDRRVELVWERSPTPKSPGDRFQKSPGWPSARTRSSACHPSLPSMSSSRRNIICFDGTDLPRQRRSWRSVVGSCDEAVQEQTGALLHRRSVPASLMKEPPRHPRFVSPRSSAIPFPTSEPSAGWRPATQWLGAHPRASKDVSPLPDDPQVRRAGRRGGGRSSSSSADVLEAGSSSPRALPGERAATLKGAYVLPQSGKLELEWPLAAEWSEGLGDLVLYVNELEPARRYE